MSRSAQHLVFCMSMLQQGSLHQGWSLLSRQYWNKLCDPEHGVGGACGHSVDFTVIVSYASFRPASNSAWQFAQVSSPSNFASAFTFTSMLFCCIFFNVSSRSVRVAFIAAKSQFGILIGTAIASVKIGCPFASTTPPIRAVQPPLPKSFRRPCPAPKLGSSFIVFKLMRLLSRTKGSSSLGMAATAVVSAVLAARVTPVRGQTGKHDGFTVCAITEPRKQDLAFFVVEEEEEELPPPGAAPPMPIPIPPISSPIMPIIMSASMSPMMPSHTICCFFSITMRISL
mmetsp:Transcript_25205/g.63428  ORF Transcript_25205/g.63428 Transcript_25205/m.63428 type:complete len:285 (+) Transcript_25205:6071-6925(+)